jgi:hypothetical protein
MLADRVRMASDPYQQGVVGALLMTGDNSRQDYDEVTAMKRYATSLGVPEQAITLDYAGFSTRTRLAQRWRRVLLKRSTWAVSPISLPTGRWRLEGNSAVGTPKVGVADRSLTLIGRQRVPELAARFCRAIANRKANDTTCLSFNRHPDPHFVPLVANE